MDMTQWTHAMVMMRELPEQPTGTATRTLIAIMEDINLATRCEHQWLADDQN